MDTNEKREYEAIAVHRMKRTAVVIFLTLLLTVAIILTNCQPVAGQRIKDVERATLVSYGKEKRFTTYWIVCVQSESGNRYSFKYNVHSYRVKRPRIPQQWTVIKTKRKTFITPEI